MRPLHEITALALFAILSFKSFQLSISWHFLFFIEAFSCDLSWPQKIFATDKEFFEQDGNISWGDNCYCHFTTSLVSTTELLSQWGDKPSHKVHCPSQNGNYLASLKHLLQYHNPISPLQLVKHSILLCDARSTIKSDYGSWRNNSFHGKSFIWRDHTTLMLYYDTCNILSSSVSMKI